MTIIYRNKKIEKVCKNIKEAIKKYGNEVTKKLYATLNIIEASKNLKDLLGFPQYNLHALKGDLDGIYSIYLGKKSGYRLLIIPLDENKKHIVCNDMSIYVVAVCVEILEISKHYE